MKFLKSNSFLYCDAVAVLILGSVAFGMIFTASSAKSAEWNTNNDFYVFVHAETPTDIPLEMPPAEILTVVGMHHFFGIFLPRQGTFSLGNQSLENEVHVSLGDGFPASTGTDEDAQVSIETAGRFNAMLTGIRSILIQATEKKWADNLSFEMKVGASAPIFKECSDDGYVRSCIVADFTKVEQVQAVVNFFKPKVVLNTPK